MKKEILRKMLKNILPLVIAVALIVNAANPIVYAGTDTETQEVSAQETTSASVQDVSDNNTEKADTTSESTEEDATDASTADANTDSQAVSSNDVSSNNVEESDTNASVEFIVDQTYGAGTVTYTQYNDSSSQDESKTISSTTTTTDNVKLDTDNGSGSVSFTIAPDETSIIAYVKWNGNSLSIRDDTAEQTYTGDIELEQHQSSKGETTYTVSGNPAGVLEVGFDQRLTDTDSTLTYIDSATGETLTTAEFICGKTYSVTINNENLNTDDITVNWTSQNTNVFTVTGTGATATIKVLNNATALSYATDQTSIAITAVVTRNDAVLTQATDSLTLLADTDAPTIGTITYEATSNASFSDDEEGILSYGSVKIVIPVTDSGTYKTPLTVQVGLESDDGTIKYYDASVESTSDDIVTYVYTLSSKGDYYLAVVTANDERAEDAEAATVETDKEIVISSSTETDSNISYELSGGDDWEIDPMSESKWYSKTVHQEDLTLKITSKNSLGTSSKISLTDLDGNAISYTTKKTSIFGGKYIYTFTIDASEDTNGNYTFTYVNGKTTKTVQIPIRIDNTSPKKSINVKVTGSAASDDTTMTASSENGIFTDKSTEDATIYTYNIASKQSVSGDVVSSNADMTVDFSVPEGNASTGSNVVSMTYTEYDADGTTSTTEEPVTLTVDSNGWLDAEVELKPASEDQQEMEYRFTEFTLTDEAGNSATFTLGDNTVEYVVDEKAPTIEYATPENPSNIVGTGEDAAYYYGSACESVTGTMTISDHNFYEDGVSTEAVDDKTAPTLVLDDDDEDDFIYPYQYICTNEGEYQFVTTAKDRVGNFSSATSPLVIIDRTSPTINVNYTAGDSSISPDDGSTVYANQAVTVNVEIDDLHIDGDAVKVTITGTDSSGSTVNTTVSGTAGTTDWTGAVTLDTDGTYAVTVEANDLAENTSSYTGSEFVVDTTAPEVTVTYDNTSSDNAIFYKANRTATITVVDYTFNTDAVYMDYLDSTSTPSESDWTNTGTNTYTMTVAFVEDGHYDFSFYCVDKAGNQSSTYEEDDFYIDKTAPTITVTYDNNNVSNEKYYNAAREATITIDEYTFAPQLVYVETQSIDGVSQTPSISDFTSDDDIRKATISFTEDGTYAYTIYCEDMAGNISEVYTSDAFVIDTTAPTISFGGVENYSANNGTVAPSMEYDDEYIDTAKSTFSISGANNGMVDLTSSSTQTDTGFETTYEDFPHTQDMDDLYTLHADIFDMAGNETTQDLVFSVNRFGSVYVLGDATKQLVSDYYTNTPQDVSITEINVDDLTYKDLAISQDGDISELSNGKNYTVNEQGSDASWKSYTYTVGAENFEEDGVYSVTVYSEDRATNSSDNRSKEKEIDFAVDQTAPSIVVSGLENNGVYKEDGHQITIDVTDNMSVTGMQVFSGDTELADYDADQLSATYGAETVTIPDEEDKQVITLVSTDMAGNEAEVTYSNILVSTKETSLMANAAQSVSNAIQDAVEGNSKTKDIIIATGGTAAGVAAISLTTVYWKRRRK